MDYDILIAMQKTYIFVDECGKSDYSDSSKTFSIVGVVIDNHNRDRLTEAFRKLKIKYFNKESFVLHRTELRNDLKVRGKDITEFANDLRKVLFSVSYFVLGNVNQKEKSEKRNWTKKRIIDTSYRSLLSNIIKFVVAKNYCAQLITEASAHEQDISLYNNFWHFMTNGISRVKIKNDDVKTHVTSISYVTKDNHDDELQLADLMSGAVQNKCLLKIGVYSKEKLNPIDNILLEVLEKRLFVRSATVDVRKKLLYPEINSYVIFPNS